MNRYTRRELDADEVYAFSLILCDNEVDRDYECFTVDALRKLQTLFLGKTGIFDHNPKGENQSARVFETSVLRDETRRTKTGDIYHCLKAKAYMVRGEKNKELMLEIDAGIKKEVSVGCSVASSVCSICGKDHRIDSCEHRPGTRYDGKLCYILLDEPTDAYEFSFVAVPSQVGAGVVKRFEGGMKDMELMKRFSAGRPVSLSAEEAGRVHAYIQGLEMDAQTAKAYRRSLTGEIVRLSALDDLPISPQLLQSMVEKMSVPELKTLRDDLLKTDLPGACQLGGFQDEKDDETDRSFLI